MGYDYRAKKIVAALSSDLQPGVALNVLGHMAVALGAWGGEDLMGRPRLHDSSAVAHVGISKYPLIVTSCRPARLRRLVQEARQSPDIFLVDYPQQMLTTGHDDELAEALASVPEEAITYLGALLYGETAAVNRLTGSFTLWR
jgi:hypothetical protein